MHEHLEKLLARSDYETIDIVRGREAFNGADAATKADFVERRRLIVRRTAGAYFREGFEIQTSSTSIGVARRYRWGPRMWEFHAAHSYLCFGDLAPYKQYFLHLETGGGLQRPFSISEEVPHSEGMIRFVVLDDPERDACRLRDALAKEDRPPLLWVMPAQVAAALRRGRTLFETLGDACAYHATGETCPDSVKAYFKERGLDLRDTMRIWNGGATFYTCLRGGLHWDEFSAGVEIRGGDLYSSDYWNLAQYHWDYPTGDRLSIEGAGVCPCGLPMQRNTWEPRTMSVELPDGRIGGYANLVAAFLGAARAEESTLLGLSFGFGPNRLAIFYEFLDPAWVVPAGTADRFASLARLPATMRVRLSRSLIYGVFKPRRLFRAQDDELDALIVDPSVRG